MTHKTDTGAIPLSPGMTATYCLRRRVNVMLLDKRLSAHSLPDKGVDLTWVGCPRSGKLLITNYNAVVENEIWIHTR